jgi:hypothetical protein
LDEVLIEQDDEVRRIMERVAAGKRADLEAWETAQRGAVLSAGARALGSLLEGIGSRRQAEELMCSGRPMERVG